MTHAPVNTSLERIKLRSHFLKSVRAFFDQRGLLEVDTTALRQYPPTDAHITSIKTPYGYLHTSPEYAMKKLLTEHAGDIYFLGHVFRADEHGQNHRPEFTMIEWYRLNYTYDQMIDETAELVRLFVDLPLVKMTYKELIGDLTGDAADLKLAEPGLPTDQITAITHFPSDQAALSQVINNHAMRFELFVHNLEVANGYLELQDPEEHRRRGIVDQEFLTALERGLPACSGVAVGFDRLLMAHHGASDIAEVIL